MRHVKSFLKKYPRRMLLYWPLFGLLFLLAERGNAMLLIIRCIVHWMTIPFCEWFVIPYHLFWFVYMVGMHIYLFFSDGEEFTYMMRFII